MSHSLSKSSPIGAIPKRPNIAPRLGEVVRRLCQPDLLKHSKGFLPEGSLDQILQLPNVKEELRLQFPRDNPNELDRLARQICHGNARGGISYRRVFAICCLMDDLATIKTLLDVKNGICDGDLPLVLHKEARNGKVEFCIQSAPHAQLKCFRGWNNNQIKLFDDWQWTVLAPILKGPSGDDCPRFDRRVVLPLIFSWCNTSLTRGPGKRFFSLKKLKPEDAPAFGQELGVLRKFNGNNAHPHIVFLFTAWRQGEDSYFLFPWADGDLLGYWELYSPLKTSEFVRWVSRQTVGLADGLAGIREYAQRGARAPGPDEGIYGRHGDIKAENILWFKHQGEGHGNMVISDFGLTEFNSRRRRSGIPNIRVARTPTYRPPEREVMRGTVSRSWDIWTLGCVYAEFATWLLGGWKLVEDFGDHRMTDSKMWGGSRGPHTDIFYELFEIRQGPSGDMMGKSARVKPEVTEWFDRLHAHAGCTQHIHDLLKFVQERILIVESPTRERAACDEVVRELRRIQERCAANEAYCTY